MIGLEVFMKPEATGYIILNSGGCTLNTNRQIIFGSLRVILVGFGQVHPILIHQMIPSASYTLNP